QEALLPVRHAGEGIARLRADGAGSPELFGEVLDGLGEELHQRAFVAGGRRGCGAMIVPRLRERVRRWWWRLDRLELRVDDVPRGDALLMVLPAPVEDVSRSLIDARREVVGRERIERLFLADGHALAIEQMVEAPLDELFDLLEAAPGLQVNRLRIELEPLEHGLSERGAELRVEIVEAGDDDHRARDV